MKGRMKNEEREKEGKKGSCVYCDFVVYSQYTASSEPRAKLIPPSNNNTRLPLSLRLWGGQDSVIH